MCASEPGSDRPWPLPLCDPQQVLTLSELQSPPAAEPVPLPRQPCDCPYSPQSQGLNGSAGPCGHKDDIPDGDKGHQQRKSNSDTSVWEGRGAGRWMKHVTIKGEC